MNFKFFAIATLCISTALPAIAAEKYTNYRIKKKTPKIEGSFLVDGHTLKEVQVFVRQNCAGGQVGKIQLVGKPREKRGKLQQKFKTTCAGGPATRYEGAKSVSIEHELMPDGRTITEMLYGKNGQIIFLQEYN